MSRAFFQELASHHKIDVLLSGYVASNDEVHSCSKVTVDGTIHIESALLSTIEEADSRIIPHISNAAKGKYKRAVVISNDTDVLVLLLYYAEIFKDRGMGEIWIKFGTGERARLIPIHLLADILGKNMSCAIMKAHILSGCDVTSKVGTKTAALKYNPEIYLAQFGESPELNTENIRLAEEYLVKVWDSRGKPKEQTFNDLRLRKYLHKNTSILDLPPTSRSVVGHIKRCYFIIRQNMSLLGNFYDDNPRNHDWIETADSLMVPDKNFAPLPISFTARCTCQKRCTGRCQCLGNETICTEFCGCRKTCGINK